MESTKGKNFWGTTHCKYGKHLASIALFSLMILNAKGDNDMKNYNLKFDSAVMEITGDTNKIKHADGCLNLDAWEKATGVSWEIPWDGKPKLFNLSVELKTALDSATKLHVGVAYYSGSGKFLGEEMQGMGISRLRYGLFAVSGMNEMKKYSAYFGRNIPEGTEKIKIFISMNLWNTRGASGSALIKSISVRECIPDPAWACGYPPIRWVVPKGMKYPAVKSPYLVWQINGPDYILPQMQPPVDRDYGKPKLSAFSAPGLVEPLSFCISAKEDLKDLKFSITELKSIEKNEIIPLRDINISKVYYMYKKISDMSTEYIFSPVYLERFENINIPTDSTQQFQLTIDVPEKSASGIYKGDILIQASNAPEMRIPVEFEVMPVKFTEPKEIIWGMYYYIFRNNKEDAIKYLGLMKSYGLNSVPACTNGKVGGDIVKDKDGNIKILWNYNDGLAKFLDAYKEAGFDKPVTWRTAIFQDAEKLGGEIGTKKFEDALSQICSLIIEEGKRRGWSEIYFISADEDYPYIFSPDLLQKYRICNKLFKKMGLKTAIHAANHPIPEAEDLGLEIYDDIDMFLLSFYHPPICVKERIFSMDWNEFRNKTRKDGKKVYYYNIDAQGIHPEIIRFGYGFGMYQKDVDGVYNWHFQHARSKNSYDDISLPPGISQFLYYYSPDSIHKGGPSIGLEAIREGIKDYKALYTLETLIKKTMKSSDAGKKQIASKAEKDINAFLGKIDFSKLNSNSCVSFPGNWDTEYYDDKGNKIISGKCKVSTGIGIEEYQNFRRKIYDYIVKLQD